MVIFLVISFYVLFYLVFNLLYWRFIYHQQYPDHPWHLMAILGPIPYVNWAHEQAWRNHEHNRNAHDDD